MREPWQKLFFLQWPISFYWGFEHQSTQAIISLSHFKHPRYFGCYIRVHRFSVIFSRRIITTTFTKILFGFRFFFIIIALWIALFLDGDDERTRSIRFTKEKWREWGNTTKLWHSFLLITYNCWMIIRFLFIASPSLLTYRSLPVSLFLNVLFFRVVFFSGRLEFFFCEKFA